MGTAQLLVQARREAGLSQSELAHRAHTSRPTLSAYERGRKSPSLTTAQRLLAETGHQLAIEPLVKFVARPLARGRIARVPTELPRMTARQAVAKVSLPLRLNWSQPGRVFQLADRSDRARVYELVLTEGTPDDVRAYVDGALLVDLWDELVLPRDVRCAWAAVITAELLPAGTAA